MIKKISIRTAQGRALNDRALKCKNLTLDDIYKTCSQAKKDAYQECKELCNIDNGMWFRIGNANTFGFTATWLFEGDGKIYRRVVTKSNSYLITFD